MISNLIPFYLFIYFAPSLLSTLRIDMEPVNFGYSTKNIPIAQPKEYLRCLIEKTESFLRRMRWKAFHFMNPTEPSTKETFGFKTTKSPAPIKELNNFENKMLTLIQNIEFKNSNCEFQNELSQDTKKIKKDNKLLIAADKTTNFYRVDSTSYNQLLKSSITKSYKKAPTNSADKIISEEKKIAKKLDLDNRIDALAEKDSFVTLKDHKPNFDNNPTCRLINPSKSEIGKISKKILQRINTKVIAATGFNQWKDTESVIKWYKDIPSKPTHSFISFDIVDFYPSISEDLLVKALNFASKYDEITDEEKKIIMQAKESLLFSGKEAWCKKSSNSHFDVTMGSFDGAETCELVGAYLLSKLSPKYGNKLGLYRDDGLAAFNETAKEIENIKKQICKTFGEHNLKLTIEANKKCVNYLDVTLDLRTESFKPYIKPGNIPQYINHNSNHPPSIIRNIPEAINRRLSNISSDKQSFESAIPPYQEALKKSGYDHQLAFNPQPPKEKHSRRRNVIWFNAPYSSNVATNIGHIFLQTIDECFPKTHPLNKLFNRNTLKLSYSCMPNISNIISSHNKAVLNEETHRNNTTVAKECNCRQKNTCPLNGKCQTEGIVYQATVTREDNKERETYVGLTETSFKTRYLNHTSSFRNAKRKSSTELSKYIWALKETDVNFSIKWNIMKQCKSYSNKTKRCNLCLYEKFIIIYHPELSSLNTRNELVSTCRHRKKHLLCNH